MRRVVVIILETATELILRKDTYFGDDGDDEDDAEGDAESST
jgi:hypothetical protein